MPGILWESPAPLSSPVLGPQVEGTELCQEPESGFLLKNKKVPEVLGQEVT